MCHVFVDGIEGKLGVLEGRTYKIERDKVINLDMDNMKTEELIKVRDELAQTIGERVVEATKVPCSDTYKSMTGFDMVKLHFIDKEIQKRVN
jgi:hypothetical protein